jgi:hypothetical protein
VLEFTTDDFNIKNSKQKFEVRNKLDKIGTEFTQFAKILCPNTKWGHYVTGKPAYNEQWGAIFPFPVKGNEELISLYPNVFYSLPQDGSDILLAANIEFKNPKEMLIKKCSSRNINMLLSKIQSATGAEISVRRKVVLRSDNRYYSWTTILWDEVNLPDINASSCTIQYLNTLQQSIQMPCKENPNDIDYSYEPVVLIKYELDIDSLISNSNTKVLLIDKVRLLVPIVEYISSK